jgi:hypothetical protein
MDRTADFRSFSITIEEVARWAGLPVDDVQDEVNRYIDQGKMEVFEDRILVKSLPELNRFVNARRGKQS